MKLHGKAFCIRDTRRLIMTNKRVGLTIHSVLFIIPQHAFVHRLYHNTGAFVILLHLVIQ